MKTEKTKSPEQQNAFLPNDIEKLLLTHGDRIRYVRIRKGYSQEQIVERVKTLSQSMLSAYEKNSRGTKLMTIPTMIKLAEVLEVSLDWLLTGKEKNISPQGRLLALSDRYAPVLSWSQIHSWKSIGKENMNLTNANYVPLLGIKSNSCFGLKIETDDISPSHPFALNDTIVIDTEKTPEPNSYVIVSHDQGNNIYLRQYIRTAEGKDVLQILEALNFEDIAPDTIFYGVVVGSFKPM